MSTPTTRPSEDPNRRDCRECGRELPRWRASSRCEYCVGESKGRDLDEEGED